MFAGETLALYDSNMLSVVIPTLNAERYLPRCFGSLMAGVMRGAVRDVIVADGGSTDATLAIANTAGAHIVSAGPAPGACLAAGAAAAKADWLLFLQPQIALETGWEVDAEAFIRQTLYERPRAAVFRFALENSDSRAEAWAAVRAKFLALPYGNQGLLMPKRLYQQLGGHRALAGVEDVDIVRRIGRRRLQYLHARAINAVRPHESALRGLAFDLLRALRVPTRVRETL